MQPYGGYPQPINVVVQNQVQPYPVYAPQPYPYPYQHPGNGLKKDTALILALVGLFTGISGLQRFYLRDTGLGILYLLTGGLCWIGQLIDVIQLATMAQVEFDRRYNYVPR
jgi:TM2 domain-containing membrane protein YozV